MTSSLAATLEARFASKLESCSEAFGETTIEIRARHLPEVARLLRNSEDFQFDQLVDLCGVDYLAYGVDEWATEEATASGFSRGVEVQEEDHVRWTKPRFGIVYHLLSHNLNHRLRMKVYVKESNPMLDSVTDIWASADWYEREAFDLFGILFEGHPDLRRILTDYGFVGHPFRKDFPLIGNVEIRYDAKAGRCVYEPVSIEPRTLVPKVIRKDQRYDNDEAS